MQVIPIQPVPSQQVLCVLGGQNCQIAIYQRAAQGFIHIYVDLNSNGTNMFLATLAHNGDPLDPCNSYDGFQGNLFFIDTQGLDDPQYTGFGTRWFLVYLTPAEADLAVYEGEPFIASLLYYLAVNSDTFVYLVIDEQLQLIGVKGL